MTYNLTRRQTLAGMGMLGAASLLGRPASAADSNKLIIPTLGGVWEKFWRETIVPDFKKKVAPDAESPSMSAMAASGAPICAPPAPPTRPTPL